MQYVYWSSSCPHKGLQKGTDLTGTHYPQEIKDRAIELINKGYTYTAVSNELGVRLGTISSWYCKHRQDLNEPIVNLKQRHKVSVIRKALDALDAGEPLRGTARAMDIPVSTIRRWTKNPRCREATYEYDPEFEYDSDDVTDCSVVAQWLCSTTTDLVERLELMLASAGASGTLQDDNSHDGHHPRVYSNRRRKAPR